jgi:hypothetical protein
MIRMVFSESRSSQTMSILRLAATVTALGAFAFAVHAPSGLCAADALKDEAVARLAASHDPAIPIAIGRVYVKQAGLESARALLAERGKAAGLNAGWGPGAPEWQAAEVPLTGIIDGIIARQVDDPAWFREAWGREAARVLNAEEADEIATHFSSDGGRQQRAVIELLLVGETLIANYTFTDRIRYGVKGSEHEMEQLQSVWWVTDHTKIYDFTPYPNAMRFATQDPGVKYSKMLAIQGIDALRQHYDAVVKEIASALRNAQGEIDPYIAQYRNRTGGN